MLQDPKDSGQFRKVSGLVIGGVIIPLGLALLINFIHKLLTTSHFDFNVYRVLDVELKEFLALIALVLAEVFFFLYIKSFLTRAMQIQMVWWKKVGILAVAAIPGFAINQITCYICEPGVFWALVGGMYLAFWVIYWYRNSIFHSTLLIILIGASLNASLSFWLHEETNRGTHLKYAKELAIPTDSLAELAMLEMISLKPPVVDDRTPESSLHAFWEKKWLNAPYLASNYEFRCSSCDTSSHQNEFEQPILASKPGDNPVYKVYFKEGYCLDFILKREIFKSVYLPSIPYKEMTRLKDYNYAVFYKNKVIRANSHDFDAGPAENELPPPGEWKKVEQEDYDAIIYRHDNDRFVLIGEPLSEVLTWISNFTFQFSLFLLLIVGIVIIQWMSKGDPRASWQRMPIQSRIQVTIFGMVFLIFFIISVGTIFFLNRNNRVYVKEVKIRNAENLSDELEEEIERLEWDFNQVKTGFLKDYSRRNLCDIDIYDKDGHLVVSSHASAANSLSSTRLDPIMVASVMKNPKAIYFGEDEKDRDFTLFALSSENGTEAILKTFFSENTMGAAHDIPLIIGDFLNVYVFLLFFAWGVGLLLVSILTSPLNLLARKLRMFELGQANEKLQWEGNDTIGRLIRDYNDLVEKLDDNARELAKAEREGAWKTMAQQIAHEINNPLTPLRLNIQYLGYAFAGRDPEEKERLDGLIKNLLEQVDKLSKIAGQFNVFARMETPELQKLNLIPFLNEFVAQYKQNNNSPLEFYLDGLEEDASLLIKVDPVHLTDVLKNLIKNAEEALPKDRPGVVLLRVLSDNEVVRIEVEDNGIGISSDIQSKLFEPSFSTKSSGSGLGLAVSRKIIEFFNGTLSFSTEEGVGTTFIISLPLNK
ncbi:MAG: HAMP domain-containing histidine kinase [Saprospiraceae bacterium]|nr:HAMP domain-containing histidine kinase [Saprospiraceae bacterium]